MPTPEELQAHSQEAAPGIGHNQPPDPSELMTPEDCIREGNIGRTTFYTKLRNGTGPKYMKIGRLVRIRRSWWDAYLKSCEVDVDHEAA